MLIPNKIIEYGVTFDLIKECHSRTKLSNYEFDNVEFVRLNKDSILIRLYLPTISRKIILEISNQELEKKN